MELKMKLEISGVNQMQRLTFPPIRSGVHVTLAAREPPERSWSRYKKILIDNPKDSNLLQRQKLWNFQKLNRGAFRSQLSSLPDIPYRVQPNTVEKVNVGVQADVTSRFSQNLRVLFPNLANKRFLITQDDDKDDSSGDETGSREKTSGHAQNDDEYSDDFDEESSVEDLGFEFDSVVRKKNVGTMTDPKIGTMQTMTVKREKKKKTIRDRRPSIYRHKLSIIKPTDTPRSKGTPKNVKFEPGIIDDDTESDEDPENVIPELHTHPGERDLEELEEIVAGVRKVEITEIPPIERVPSSASSTDSRLPHIPIENVGPSSNLTTDPISILDFISGSLSNRSRNSDNGNKRRAKFSTDPDADRIWFEKIVGDKEVIDSGTYENFARSRPNTDYQSDANNEKYTDLTKSSPRKNFTPRINDEFPVYHSVQAKSQRKPTNNSSQPMNVNKNKNRRGLINIGKSY